MKKHLTVLGVALSAMLSSHAAVTWYFVSTPSDSTIAAQITSAMNAAVANYNTYANYTANIPVSYNAGVPTAQASYGGWIEFGGSRNARVAQHEMAHWFGCGTISAWGTLMTGGTWDGVYANSKIQAYDGTAEMSGDSQHFWPYGWNYDSEAQWPQRNIGLVGGFRRDMGLSDMTIGIGGSTFDPYRLQNRASGKCLDNYGVSTDGTVVRQYTAGSSNNQKWLLSMVNGTYFKLQCLTGSKYLDTLGNTADNTPVGQWSSGSSTNQEWSIIQTDSGYYKIINRANGKCLDTGGDNADGAIMENWGSGSSYNQQWKFLN